MERVNALVGYVPKAKGHMSRQLSLGCHGREILACRLLENLQPEFGLQARALPNVGGLYLPVVLFEICGLDLQNLFQL